MELRRGTDAWSGWWAVLKPDKKLVEYLRRSVPPLYRQFDADSTTWYVHDKYAEAVKQMMYSSGMATIEEDPWAVLHLRPGAPQAIIKAVWKVMAAELHPDRGGDEAQFIKVKAAYEKLTKV